MCGRAGDQQLVQRGVGGLLRAVGQHAAAAAEREGAADLVEGVRAVPALAAGDHDRVLGDLGGQRVDGPLRAREFLQPRDRVDDVRPRLSAEQRQRQRTGDQGRGVGTCPSGQDDVSALQSVGGEQAGERQQLRVEVAAVIIEGRLRQVALGVEGEGHDRHAGEREQPDRVGIDRRAQPGDARGPEGRGEQESGAEQRPRGVEAAVAAAADRQRRVHEDRQPGGDDQRRG